MHKRERREREEREKRERRERELFSSWIPANLIFYVN